MSADDAYVMRNVDGYIIDWLPGDDGTVLMARDLRARSGQTGHHHQRHQEGLGVDRVDTDVAQDEAGRAAATRRRSSYMTDGLGNVRIMAAASVNATGMTDRRDPLFLPHAGSQRAGSRWATIERRARASTRCAVDAGPQLALRAARRRTGATRCTGSSSTVAGRKPSVPPSPTCRHRRCRADRRDGQRVIGYTYADECGTGRLFRSRIQQLSRSLSQGAAESAADRFRRFQPRREQAPDPRRQRHRSRPLLSVRPRGQDISTRRC